MSISKETYLTKREIINLIYFVGFFFWLVFSYSLFTAFYLPVFLSVIAVFAGTFIFSRYIFSRLHPRDLKVYVLGLSLIISQLIWLVNSFLISHWTGAAILLVVYFTLWDMLRLNLQEKLTWKLVVRDIVFGIVGAGLLLLSSRIII